MKHAFVYLKGTLFLFFIATLYGWLMRLNLVITLPFLNYNKVLQAHSHVTFLGWAFITTTVLFNVAFLDKNVAFSRKYKWLFSIELISVGLMLVSFPWQGYNVFSIVLLSVFAITSYVYFYHFYTDFKKQKQYNLIRLFVNVAIFYYLLAMFAIWAVGAIVATKGKGELYHNTIYFYLHFLYNGFFMFALFALFFQYLKKQNIVIRTKNSNLFFWFLFLACLPSYALSLVESSSYIVITIGFLSAIMQLVSGYYFFKFIKELSLSLDNSIKLVLKFIVAAFTLKISLQLLSAFPVIAKELPVLKSYFVIGYIHLVTLGIISLSLIVLLVLFNFISINKPLIKNSIYLFIIGFLGTELLLFSQGIVLGFKAIIIPRYNMLLFIFTTVLLLSISIFILAFFKTKNRTIS